MQAQVKGIVCFGIGLTLREGDREYFYQALDRHFPGLRQRYCEKYGNAYEVASDNHARLMDILRETCEKHGILYKPDEVFAYLRAFPAPDTGEQLSFL